MCVWGGGGGGLGAALLPPAPLALGPVLSTSRHPHPRLLLTPPPSHALPTPHHTQVNILRELRHPHIVRYYDRIIDKAATKLYIVMEYCEGGDLGAVIKKARREGGAVEEDVVWKVLAQITAALKECHRHREAAPAAGSGGGGAPGSTPKLKPILHRDLKPGNIFLDGAQNVKIGDFGLAKELASESKFAYTNVGTPFYMSPEMINEMRYNEKSDIWALGCLVFELCALVPPFEAQNQLALAVKINAGKFNRIPARYSEDLYRAIRWMLQVDVSGGCKGMLCHALSPAHTHSLSHTHAP